MFAYNIMYIQTQAEEKRNFYQHFFVCLLILGKQNFALPPEKEKPFSCPPLGFGKVRGKKKELNAFFFASAFTFHIFVFFLLPSGGEIKN